MCTGYEDVNRTIVTLHATNKQEALSAISMLRDKIMFTSYKGDITETVVVTNEGTNAD